MSGSQTALSKTLQTPKAQTSVSGVISSTSSEVTGVVSSVSSDIGQTISSAEDMVSSGIAAITSPIHNITVSLSNIAGKAISGVSDLIGSAENAAVSGVSNVITDLFGNSKDNSSLKTSTPDNVKSATVSGKVANGLYKVNSQYAQTTPVDLNNPLPQLTSGTAGLSTIATRLGMAVTDSESALLNAGAAFTHGSLVSGIMSSARSVGQSYSTLMDLAHQGTSIYETAVNLPSTLKLAGESAYQATVSSLAQQVTGTVNGLNGFYNSSYPTTTMADGSSTSLINPNLPSPMLTSLYNSVNSRGCTYATVPGIYAYSAQESIKDAELSMAYAFGLKGLLQNITSCSNYNRTVQATGASLFTQDFGNNPGGASILGEALNPSIVSLPTTQAKAAVTNSSVPDSDAQTIADTFSRYSIDGDSLYQSDSSFAQKSKAAGLPVYDISTLNSSSAAMVSTITKNTTIKAGVPSSTLVAI